MWARLQKCLAIALLLSVAGAVQAQNIISPHCPWGCPVGIADANNTIVDHEIFMISNNPQRKFADWVAHAVRPDWIGPTATRQWKADPWLDPADTLQPTDYDGANAALQVDRGHQATLTSFTNTPHWQRSNYLSNITPQKSALNQGPWRLLEEAIHKAVKARGETMFVLTGPYYSTAMPTPNLPNADQPHQIPSGYWKVVVRETDAGLESAAFVMPQDTERGAKFCDSRTSIDQVEILSSLELFAPLPDTDEAALETGPGLLAPLLGCIEQVAAR